MSFRLYVCMYVCLSVRARGKRDFFGPQLRYRYNFFLLQIPLINEHLFCKYFVHLSVGNATKLCYLWMLSSLFNTILRGLRSGEAMGNANNLKPLKLQYKFYLGGWSLFFPEKLCNGPICTSLYSYFRIVGYRNNGII